MDQEDGKAIDFGTQKQPDQCRQQPLRRHSWSTLHPVHPRKKTQIEGPLQDSTDIQTHKEALQAGKEQDGMPPPSQWLQVLVRRVKQKKWRSTMGGKMWKQLKASQQLAQLCGNPKLLRIPRDECIQEIGGNKPAKDFTRER